MPHDSCGDFWCCCCCCCKPPHYLESGWTEPYSWQCCLPGVWPIPTAVGISIVSAAAAYLLSISREAELTCKIFYLGSAHPDSSWVPCCCCCCKPSQDLHCAVRLVLYLVSEHPDRCGYPCCCCKPSQYLHRGWPGSLPGVWASRQLWGSLLLLLLLWLAWFSTWSLSITTAVGIPAVAVAAVVSLALYLGSEHPDSCEDPCCCCCCCGWPGSLPGVWASRQLWGSLLLLLLLWLAWLSTSGLSITTAVGIPAAAVAAVVGLVLYLGSEHHDSCGDPCCCCCCCCWSGFLPGVWASRQLWGSLLLLLLLLLAWFSTWSLSIPTAVGIPAAAVAAMVGLYLYLGSEHRDSCGDPCCCCCGWPVSLPGVWASRQLWGSLLLLLLLMQTFTVSAPWLAWFSTWSLSIATAVGISAVATWADLNAICIIAQLTRSWHLIHSEKYRVTGQI